MAKNLPKISFVSFYEQCIIMRACAYQGVRNITFSENFAYVLNE